MKKILIIVLIAICFGCRGAKYNISFENESLDFNKGKWVLNEVFNKDDSSRLYDHALERFGKIIGGSLFEIQNVRNTGSGLMVADVQFEPDSKTLKEIGVGTSCDYLINIKATTLSDEMSGFTGSSDYESEIKENIARVEIKIFDLNKGSLLSSADVLGIDKREVTQKQDWGIVTDAKAIKVMGLLKLIKKYKKKKK